MSSPPFAENEGAKRKLTYADGSTCFETVVETNGVDSIRVQVTEHPFPCEILYAHMSTERVDDNNCIFKIAAEYKLNDGIKPEDFEPGTLWLFQAIADGGAKAIADNVAKPAKDGYHVWGVNAKEEIYYRAGHSGSWERIAGALKNIAVSGNGNHVWGVNSNQSVYYRAGKSGIRWQGVDRTMIQVCVSDDGNHVWGVNAKDEIYYRAGFSGSWERIAGALKHVSVSSDGNHVWGVNTHDKVYYRAGRSAGKWTAIDGAMTQVSVGSDDA